VVIGSLDGQSESAATSFDLPFSPPPPGNWRFVLMLREWTAAGYVTRDFTNFLIPVNYGPPPATAALKTEGLASARTTPVKPAAPAEVALATRLRDSVAVSTATAEPAPGKNPGAAEDQRIAVNGPASSSAAAKTQALTSVEMPLVKRATPSEAGLISSRRDVAAGSATPVASAPPKTQVPANEKPSAVSPPAKAPSRRRRPRK